jgi:chromosome segregation ATPase
LCLLLKKENKMAAKTEKTGAKPKVGDIEIEIPAQAKFNASLEAIELLEDENEKLKQRIAEVEELLLGTEDRLTSTLDSLELKSEQISELENENKALKSEVNGLEVELSELIAKSEQAGRTIKTDLLIAIAPHLNIDHPRPEAQKAERAVDEMMKVWGL